MPLNERAIIARRAAMELLPGCNVNLGIGIPGGIAYVAAEEGVSDMITLTSESGTIGGIPAGGHDFGLSRDADAYVEMTAQFDWYSGGGVDVAFEGAAQVDANGNVNVSKFNGLFVGCGGFIDITQHAGKVVYCGTFTAGGLKLSVADGKLAIQHEGKVKKYIKAVEQVTFSGAYAGKMRQPRFSSLIGAACGSFCKPRSPSPRLRSFRGCPRYATARTDARRINGAPDVQGYHG
jgi:propionate CoA-transferase